MDNIRYSPVPYASRSEGILYTEPWIAFNGNKHKRFRTKADAEEWLIKDR